MKKALFIVPILALSLKGFATDFIVQESGPVGTYSSISSAITASSDGDRILIHPKIGGNAWVENLTINKSLEFASAQNEVHYKVEGSITLQAQTNRKVTLIGAQLTTGSLTGSGTGYKTTVNVLGCIFDAGGINLSDQFYANLVSNTFNNTGISAISFAYGNAIGNDLSLSSLVVLSNPAVVDTMQIIANKCRLMIFNSTTNPNYLYIKNNFIGINDATTSLTYVVDFNSNYPGIFQNNTVKMSRPSVTLNTNYFCRSNSLMYFKNNVFRGNSSNYPVAFLGGSGNTYNYFYNAYGTSTSIPTNQMLTNDPINTTTGELILPTPAQNGADPSFEFYDLDLTRGDAGCYGGSYSLNNYFPITGSARVFSIDLPWGIISTGTPLNIKADGFDR